MHDSIQRAVDAIDAVLGDTPKGLRMGEVKRIIATELSIQRVHSSKLKPILELGHSSQRFSVEGKRVIPYMFEVPIDRFGLMSREAQEYYAKAIKVHPGYANQAEIYLDYCEKCKAKGIDPVHPKQWVCGDTEE